MSVCTDANENLSPAFLEFLELKLIEFEDAAARGDTIAAGKAETLGRMLSSLRRAPESRATPMQYSNVRPTLDDFNRAGEKWGNS